MKVSMRFKDYLDAQQDQANEVLCLDILIAPFGMSVSTESSSKRSETLLVGHVLDELSEDYAPQQQIDCLDVAKAAWNLGFAPAEGFLDEAPLLIWQLSKAMPASG